MVKKLVILLIGVFLMTPHIKAQLSYAWDQSIPVEIQGQQLKIAWAGGINAAQVSTMDLNEDGRDDLVIFDRTSEKTSTYLITDSSYQYAPYYESLFPPALKGWMLLRDYNCDGKKDLFTHTPFGIKVYENVTTSGGSLDWQLVLDPIFTIGSSGLVNLQVNVVDLPGIDDLDGDGDLDILVYNFAVGGGIEYHKNLSFENTGTCGLEFERITKYWGDFLECECDLFAFGDELCEDIEPNARTKHIGGKTLATLDFDNDGDKEVLVGQEDCQPLYYLENIGNPDEALMREFSLEFPDQNNPISYFTFPASYYEDLDGDGLKDLISSTNFSSNHDNGIDFSNSFWFYKNIGSSSLPEFEFVAKDYLQSDMIDLGESASPAFADYDRDGDMDLFVGFLGSPENGQLIGGIWFFQNTGTASKPSFSLLDEDYLGIKDLGFSHLKLQFADINNDGNSDLILMGSSDGSKGNIRIFFNQSSNIFSFDKNASFVIPIEFLSEDQFHFTDINGDQLIDLLLARKTGQLDYFRNIGTSSTPEFLLDTENFYGIADDFSKKDLSITVSDLDNDRNLDLLTIDESGEMVWYSGFLQTLSNPRDGEALVFEGLEAGEKTGFNFGEGLSITTAPLFNEIGTSIIAGLRTGGLQVLRKSNAQPTPPSSDGELTVIIYPNPSGGQDSGILSVSSNEEGEVQIISNRGQEVSSSAIISPGKIVQFDTRGLPSGLYLVKVASTSGKVNTKQLVVIN
jgi:hypothetical protein